MMLEVEFEDKTHTVSLISPRAVAYNREAERPVSEVINVLNIWKST